MTILSELWARCNYGDTSACAQFRKFFRDLLESMYLARHFPRIPPVPQPGPKLDFEPTPTPMIEEVLANQQFLINQLMLNALGNPNPQPNIFSYIRERQLHRDVAKQLLTQFEQAADEMRQIVETAGE